MAIVLPFGCGYWLRMMQRVLMKEAMGAGTNNSVAHVDHDRMVAIFYDPRNPRKAWLDSHWERYCVA